MIPNYNQFVAPQVKKGQVLFAKHVSPIVSDLSSKILVIYKVHLEPQITSAVKSIEPARKQFSKEASKLLKSSVVQVTLLIRDLLKIQLSLTGPSEVTLV